MTRSARIWKRGTTLAALVFFSAVSVARSQQPNGAPTAEQAASPAGPAAALRKVLSAACAHDAKAFGDSFTTSNRETFSHMTAAAQVSLMKRFVLLDDPGQPSVSANPAGRPIVRCRTPLGAAEMQIGGADVRESVAFLPLELRDADDAAGNVMRIKIGLVREGGEWKILSLGLLLLDLSALEVEWEAAEVGPGEQAALQTLKALALAIENYRRTYTKLPDSMSALGPPLHGGPTGQAAGLIDSDVALGVKNGYTFRYVIATPSTSGAQARYELAATPVAYGKGGRRSFFRDAEGRFHAADHQGAVGSAGDPSID